MGRFFFVKSLRQNSRPKRVVLLAYVDNKGVQELSNGAQVLSFHARVLSNDDMQVLGICTFFFQYISALC